MKTIVVIGGGLSGVLTAIQLLEKSKTISVKIIHSGPSLGLGIAYNTNEAEHLLNVPAGKMSAFSSNPKHFTDWLDKNGYPAENLGGEFLPRMLYGKYIQELVLLLLSNKQLEIINAKAIDILENESSYNIKLNDSKLVVADKIILALGNFLPANPKLNSPTFYTKGNYFQNPWSPSYLKDIDKSKDILLIGTGLTMVDCALSLKNIGYNGKIWVVSPRGYTPASHGKSDVYPDFYSELKEKSLLEIFKTVRKHLKIAESKNSSWRGVIDSLRPHAQEIWIALSLKEKQQFVSHIRHIWGIARHRLPVKTYNEIHDLKSNGKLEIIGGRILDMREDNGIILANIRLRKSGLQKELMVSRVVNCTGPQTNYKELQDELIVNLLSKNMIIPDDLKMGIKTTLNGQILQNKQQASADIYAIGSLLRGVLWETTAVPEIRVQAESIAQQIIDSIN